MFDDTHLFHQDLPVPADHGSTAQTARVQEREDVEGEEARQDPCEVHVLQGHMIVEPVLYKVQLVLATVVEEHVQETAALGISPEVKLNTHKLGTCYKHIRL